ncbi:hypothetical protein B0H15DRAFT_836629 [Mycena belliarum]|uniref:Uncharacterized protein n=1 Tax=Mycena belliarum TaxID=1033014 RepID=A0AAD6U6T5_9AGAR|nr:hypothetical protein B0H15DRAFT_836629 [Mycena belliae]
MVQGRKPLLACRTILRPETWVLTLKPWSSLVLVTTTIARSVPTPLLETRIRFCGESVLVRMQDGWPGKLVQDGRR